MRRPLDDGWAIELSGTWERGRTKDGVTTWRAVGRTMQVSQWIPWLCSDGADIIAALDAQLPPNPVGKVGEGGQAGVGHRAAWLYRHDGDAKFILYGYNFSDRESLKTAFTSADTADPKWAFDAWRSVTRFAG